jgi:G3E family GTPase
LIEQQGVPLMTLSGGCLCCQIRGAFAPVLKNLWMAWSRGEIAPFERILIEASGVASPEPILDTLLRQRWLASRYRLDAIVTTLAIPSALNVLNRFSEARAQLAWADAIVLTHGDLADAGARRRLDSHLAQIAPVTPVYSPARGDLDPQFLKKPRVDERARGTAGGELPAHGFHSVSLDLDDPLPWPRLQTVLAGLLERHRSDLMRVKGIVHLPGRSDPMAIHAAAGRLHPPLELPRRPSDDGRSRLVFITAGPMAALADDLRALLGGTAVQAPVHFHRGKAARSA